MAHVAHRDLLVGLVQRMAVVLYWWNPLVARMSAAIALVREQICDDLVSEHTRGAEGYAALIVELAARLVDRRLVAGALGAVDGSASELGQRVKRMLDADRPLITAASRATVAAGAAFSLLILASLMLSSFHLAAARADDAPAEQKKDTPVAAPPAADAEMAAKTVRIVDPDGDPIAGAAVEPWALRTKLGHGMWLAGGYGGSAPPKLKSDADGHATIRFPKLAIKDDHVAAIALTCRVAHPDFAESTYNDVSVTDAEVDEVATIMLHKGAQVKIRVTAGGQAARRRSFVSLFQHSVERSHDWRVALCRRRAAIAAFAGGYGTVARGLLAG